MSKIRIGLMGYGNLGRGAELAIQKTKDMELQAVFTRRDPDSVHTVDPRVNIYAAAEAEKYASQIDVLLLCGGSATDLPEQGPRYAKYFNTVDSFDTHAKIPEYFMKMDQVLQESGHVGIISVGWDPGLFSINRMMSQAILPDGKDYTFWGTGVSQGHSDAIRRIEGVADAKQYTIPVEEAVEAARSGKNPELSTREKHKRCCYVVLKDGADAKKVEEEIKTMPNYFAEYDTQVHFLSMEQFKKEHSAMPHGGFVIRSGKTGEHSNHVVEYSLKLDSNPEFTASVLVAYARAAYRLSKAGNVGCKTVFDIAPVLLSDKTPAELRKTLL